MDYILERKGWKRTGVDAFWGETAPSDHIVQIYDTEAEFITTLESFVSTGLDAGESVVLIATTEHLKALNSRLRARNYDLFTLTLKDQYIALTADEVLAQFLINDWPDENLFFHLLTNLLLRARKKDRPVRAFGEMVALLWSRGLAGATVRLEHLWTRYCEQQKFNLFCAYPRSIFTDDPVNSIAQICQCHSKVVALQDPEKKELAVKVA